MQRGIFFSKQKTDGVLIFVGGSGDKKEDFEEIAIEVQRIIPDMNCCTLTLSDILSEQVSELVQVSEKLVEQEKMRNLFFFGTSMGAYAICFLLRSRFSNYIKSVILFDPADYYIQAKQTGDLITWSGGDKYNPKGPTASDLLEDINGEVKITVVYSKLKNYGEKGYLSSDFDKRGEGSERGVPRLNREMVKAFYDKTPANNKGKYYEVDNIPHAFNRDGSIEQNRRSIAELIFEHLKND